MQVRAFERYIPLKLWLYTVSFQDVKRHYKHMLTQSSINLPLTTKLMLTF